MGSNTDSIKWEPHARVLKYGPESVVEVIRYMDTHNLRTQDRVGSAPTGPELRIMERRHGLTPDSIAEAHGNLLTTAGLNRITNLIIGGGAQAFTNSRAAIGVGDSTTTATAADAALGGNSSTHSWWQAPDASNPTQANGVITCNSTFGISDGNFTAGWQEWGWGIATAAVSANAVFNTATTTGVLLNHKVQNLGTKVSGAIWTLQATVTLS